MFGRKQPPNRKTMDASLSPQGRKERKEKEGKGGRKGGKI
jgi:hypothetical protein